MGSFLSTPGRQAALVDLGSKMYPCHSLEAIGTQVLGDIRRTPDLTVMEPADVLGQLPPNAVRHIPEPWQVEACQQSNLYRLLYCP